MKRGIARGEFRAVDPEYAAQMIAAPMVFINMWCRSLAPHATRRIDPLRYLETHLEMLRHALARN